ncbi:TonB-dependent Receptor Plug Domain [Cyclobacterium xiamenense]|uniref:TonB-dependent Receptor Plug Domain n=1 Tax=Cyclobacterium xiamenense TaxID=1297121 RepID=A0A1H6WJF7_9BACT|nr:TonB-dependent receptor [Cyclobacterium xiamenense]SEJ17199.1 TonB-dependent Receptor Plug Domain [Cyclobacterium xiamenense]
MKMILKSWFFLGLALMSTLALAQNGTVRGTIYDEGTGEPLFGVAVAVVGTQIGAVTDFDGDFELQLSPGTYTLQASFISYNTLSLEGIVVTAEAVTVLDNLKLTEYTSDLETVTISADAIRTTEAALMIVKRNAPQLMDGISSAAFRQIGDGDAASAIKRVTGVSIEGGKYVYIRGLGDRYTKTVLNGVDIPGLDPDRNTIQMDIFPTNIIDNIIVSKSFTSNLPADFTGGVVDIETKDFPEEKTIRVSVSGGYNPSMHFNGDFLRAGTSGTDFLGFDNGFRDIPTKGVADIPQFADVVGNPSGERGQLYQRILRDFNPEFGGRRDPNAMNMGLGFSLGNQVAVGSNTLGYNLALTYKNTSEYFQDAEYNLFAKSRDIDETQLEPLERSKGSFGVNNVLLGGLFGLAYKTDLSKYKLNLIRLQNGESKVGVFDFENTNLGAVFEADQYNIEYSQRSLTNLMLSGAHFLKNGGWEVNWKVSPTLSTIDDPDVRVLRFRRPNLTISSEVGLPQRIWRSLDEQNLVGKLDLTNNHQLFGKTAKLKFGSSYVYKQRDFLIEDFQFSTGTTSFTGDPNEVLREENLFSESNRNGVRYNPLFIPTNPNSFNASLSNVGLYMHSEFSPIENWKAIVGVRAEKYDQYYTGSNQTQTIVFDNERVLDDMDFFPTINLINGIKENQNIRLSFSRTIARPSFKEMSFAEILDPITGRTFVGGLFEETTNGGTEVLWNGQLEATRINNFDLRWEKFLPAGQLFSVSAFYKTFDKPIEMVQFLSDPGAFQPRNVGNGTVAGLELELRKSLSFVAPNLENLFFTFNGTLTESSIQMSASELRSRQLTAREGEQVDARRDMAGQAPYIINSGIAYNDFVSGLEAGIFYNVQGSTLNYIGFGNRTDTYTVPFHAVNLSINKTLGQEERMKAGLVVQNLLNQSRQEVFRSYQAEDQIFTSLNPGTLINFSFSYSL